MFHQADAPKRLFPTGKADPRALSAVASLGFADASIVTVALGDHLNVPAPKGA